MATKLVYVVVRARERGVYRNELFSLRKAKVLGKRSCHFLYSQKRAQRFEEEDKEEEEEEILYRMARRKNPHPQRAVNVKTVVVGDDEEEEQEPVLCLQIPPDEDDDDVFVVVDDDIDDDEDDDDDEEEDDDDYEMDEQIRKEETAFRKGSKRKRTQHECDVCEKMFGSPSQLAVHIVRTRTRNRTSVMCARSVLLELIV